jgi:hypothetical protein
MRLADVPRFLSYDELAYLVGRFEYKPGWRLSVYSDVWEGPVLRIVASLPDSYHPDETIELRINSRIPPMQTESDFAHYLLWRLDQIERHECRENLRLDGKILYDPHDPIEP